MLVFKNSRFEIDPNMLGIGVLRSIYDRDTSKDKELAFGQLMWLYYYYNPRSPFRSYKESLKHSAIIEQVFPRGLQEPWDPWKDEEFQKAVTWYTNHVKQNPFWDSWKALKTGMERLQKILIDEKSTVYEIAKARDELSRFPKDIKKMEEEALKEDTILDTKTTTKTIRSREQLPKEAQRN